MMPNALLTTHQQNERLNKELDLLKAEYANQWNNLNVLAEWGKPPLESLYYAQIGELQIELLQ